MLVPPGAVLGHNSEQENIKLLQSQMGQSFCAWGLKFLWFGLLHKTPLHFKYG